MKKNHIHPLALTVVANNKRLPIDELTKTISQSGKPFSLKLAGSQLLDEDAVTAVDFFLTEESHDLNPSDEESGFIPKRLHPFHQELKEYFHEMEYDFCIQNFDPVTRRKKVFFSDMDSTLIENETLDDIALKAGVGEQVAAITLEGIEGKINFHESMEKRLSFLKGKDIVPLINSMNDEIRYNDGAHTLIKTLNHHGVVSYLVTGGFDPIASHIKENLGITYLLCNHFEMMEMQPTGKWLGDLVTGQKKLHALETFLSTKGMLLTQAMAMGDGANDIPMLKAAELGVGYRARDKVKKEIPHQIHFTSLTTLLYYQGYTKAEFVHG